MSVRVIADPGSCHFGSLKTAMELVRAAANAGVWAIKFQLFPKRFTKTGNVQLPEDYFRTLVPYAHNCGIECFASVFSPAAYRCLHGTDARYVKFSFGRFDKLGTAIADYGRKNVFVSGNENNPESIPPVKCNWLYCIPEYPVERKVNFAGLFGPDGWWCGFSDHTRATAQTKRAIDAGAEYIEKHLRLGTDRDDTVPDGRFAVTPKQLEEICKYGE